MANDSYKARSTGPKGLSKKGKEIERSHYPVLLQAQKAWEEIDPFRHKRKRNRNYTYGKQWNDLIKLPDGRVMSEEEYIRQQGKVPLKNNLIRQMVKSVLGQFRNNQTQPVCVARDREEQNLGELMSAAVQYAYQHNRLQELDSRTMEEFLISGICFQKIGYGFRRGKSDVWVDEVNPNRIFFNAMEDSRHWDCTLIGELHDMPIAEVISRFSFGSRERAVQLRQIYTEADNDTVRHNFENLTTRAIDRLDFYMPSSPDLCRVIEVWKLESQEILNCHDFRSGEYYNLPVSEAEAVEKENKARRQAARQAGIPDEAVALIETEWGVTQTWRYRFFSPLGDLLDEGDTPYWHGEHPYVFKLYPLIDGEVHAFVEDVIDQQRYINRLITMIDFIMGSSAKGVLLFPEDQIPDGMTIDDIADEWTKYNGIILFRPRPGSPMPQQIAVNATQVGAYEMLSLQMRLFEDISGVHGAMQGKAAPAGTPSSLYSQQIQYSSTNLLDLFESFKTFREDRDIKIMKTIQQFYTDSRYRTIAGNSCGKDASTYTPEEVRNTEFDLSIAETLSTPALRMASNEFLMELFRGGKISLEMLLQNGAFPFADKLLQSLKQSQTEQMQAQAQAAQPQSRPATNAPQG
ncbi:hypothetical protein BARVI_04680 [Barnesiella viscericola DSM 18177]|uniref:Portal protein n=1 Tax=Barnesiella viscericola DSM 18177 TaxID=880074 RepID=W0ERQ3_9BACT|nr:hypothetical protein [Barnesiella viscericola]AHF12193.1 hypothetical protein BARVI_04680 [Barnesiella viscericola DSM 18177]